jgi:hypothetical protein
MADSSNIDFEKLVIAWEEEDLLNIMEWGGLPQKRCKTQNIVQNPIKVTK